MFWLRSRWKLQLNASLEQARAKQDVYEIGLYKDQLDQLGHKYQAAKQQVDKVRAQQEEQQIKAASEALRERGLEYLLSETPQAQAWTEYTSSKLSEGEFQMAIMVPSIAEAFEKARKYDAANSKGTKSKIKKTTKTLKSGTGTKIQSQKTKAEQARKTRLKSGTGSQSDVDSAALSVAQNILGL